MAALPDPILVTKQEHLSRVADRLLQERLLAVDTESNSLFAYRERVCLIQFSTPDADYLVDPLALKDVSPLTPIFKSTQSEKIFHAAEYDLLTLKRDFGFTFNNIFDTMVAARILGRERVGLGNLLEEEFKVRLQKKYQRADWGKRPLSADMLAYARLDTHYLIRLRERFKPQLEQWGRWPIAAEDFTRLTQVDGHRATPPQTDIWRMRGAEAFAPQQMAVLQALVDYRREVAEQRDRPLFKILGDPVLVAVAEAQPKTQAALEAVPALSPRQARQHGKRLLQAVQAGLGAKAPKRARRRARDEEKEKRIDALKSWRRKTAQGMGVESDVVLPRDLLYTIAARNPHTQAELAAILKETPWRLQQYGAQIQDLLAKQNHR